jgi:alpha-D-ribose 1-methylphosphonate 5-phosphate C-P lyase
MAMETDIYKTSDIALASYLYCSGASLAEIDRQNPQRCIFVFQSPKPEILSKWQEGKANVNAMAFYNAYQYLKYKVYKGLL